MEAHRRASRVPSIEELRATGTSAGLDDVGVAAAAPFDGTRQLLEERKAAGLHGGMQFTYRNPARSTDPGRALPGARSLVVGARRYRRADPARPPDAAAGAVARYARHDHYADLRHGLAAVAQVLTDAGWGTRVLCDDNALVDREAAVRAGLGWYGKSTNVLLPGSGSWFVLGSVVTDAPIEPAPSPLPDGCGSCTRCITGCPTGAIVAPGVVDARRCLAWLVQAPGPIPIEHREALGDRIYGCDDCQEVCPPNRVADRSGDLLQEDGEAWVPLVDLLRRDDEALLERHGRWYIPRRDPRFLRRNALVALGNSADPFDPEVRTVVAGYAGGDDELLREHAAWAAERLDRRAAAAR